MFFLEAGSGGRLGVHVEFKHAGEPLLFGQAEGYLLILAHLTEVLATFDGESGVI